MYLYLMVGYKMFLLPRSLWGRTILVIILVVILSNTATHFLIRYYFVKPKFEQQLTLIARNIEDIYAALHALPDEQRQGFVNQLPEINRYHVITSNEENLPYPELSQFPQLSALVTKYIAPELAESIDTRVQLTDQRVIWFGVEVSDRNYWIGVPFVNFQSRFPLVLLIWLLITGILAFLGSFWLVRKLNRSLGNLTQATETLSTGGNPQLMQESGPVEIRKLSKAFNKMTHDIETLTKNRTLLLAGVSHDLRTPLSRIRLMVEMLSKDNIEATKAELIHDIEAVDKIIEQFLLFIRDCSEENFSQANINQLIQSVCKRYSRQQIPFKLSLKALPDMILKPIAFQRVLINLIDNAIKYAPGTITIITEPANNQAIIRVLDKGPGIPLKERSHLLEPFTQLEKAENIQGGIGLGLAIAKRIIEQHQGQLNLCEREGGGLEVKITMPTDTAIQSLGEK